MSVASLERFVHPGPWTIADVEALPETGSRFEILAPGVLTVSPGPASLHQRASRRLANLIEAAAQSAGVDVEVLEAMNVEIPGERLTIPDIAVVDANASDANTTRFQPSQVLLAVEIVSPSSKAADRAIKPDLYAEAAIPAYWRLELDPEPRLFGFELRGDRYHQVTDVPAGERRAITAGGISVELDPGELIRR
ncbi:MAG TPA: Uma2 family endonuclease [Acidothermaceae bacterium]|nr:Uma2 family endonuclease [Acidothermaceae bacterium]